MAVLSSIAGLLNAWAIVAIAGAGLATIAQVRPLQAWFAKQAVISIIAALALPAIGNVATGTLANLLGRGSVTPPTASGGVPGLLFLVVLGHIAILVFLVRRRMRARRGSTGADDLSIARGRRRERISVDSEDDEL